MVATPVWELKLPTGSTVADRSGGGGALSTEICKVPPLPDPGVSSNAMMYTVSPAVTASATAPGPQVSMKRLPGVPVATMTPAE
jgi:hypothetical protein